MADPDAALALIRARGAALTRRQLGVLALMARAEALDPGSDDAELVYERGRGYVGLEPVGGRTLFALLRACAVSLSDGQVGGLERYRLNETGRALVGGGTV